MSALDHIRIITSNPGPKQATWRAEPDVKDWDTFATWLITSDGHAWDWKYARPFVAGTFTWSEQPGTGRRLGVHLVERHVIQLDADKAGDDYLERLAEVAGFLRLSHTTASHMKDGKGARWRTLVPLSRPVSPSEYLTLSTFLVDLVGRERFGVVESTSPAAVSYAPAWARVEYDEHDGPVLDVDGYLMLAEPLEWHPTTSVPDATVEEFLDEHPATGQACAYGRAALERVAEELEAFPANDGAGFHQKIGGAGMRFVELVEAGCWSADDADRLREATNHRDDPRPKEFDEAIAYGLGKGCGPVTGCDVHAPLPFDVIAEEHTEEAIPERGGSWQAIDLGDTIDGLLSGALTRREPTIGDFGGGCLFYSGAVNGIAGASGSGKSWAALLAASQEIAKGEHVVYVDLEDDPLSVVSRLLDSGADAEDVRARFHYVRPEESYTSAAAEAMAETLARWSPSLVVIDSTGESMALDGAKPNDDDDTARWFRRLPSSIAKRGPAVVVLDHVVKSDDGGLWPIGSQRKRAAISGAQYMQKIVVAFDRTTPGWARLICAKDRHGNARLGAAVAELHVRPGLSRVEVSLLPGVAAVETGDNSEAMKERVAEFLAALGEDHEGASGNTVRREVPGKNDAVDAALKALVAEGYVTKTAKGQSMLHRLTKPYVPGFEVLT